MTRPQADRLVQLALTAAAGLGLSLSYHGDAALVPVDRSADRPVLGLGNLARVVSRYEEDRWPEIVTEHLGAVVEQFRAGPPVPPADPERELIQRIVARDALPPDWTEDRPDFLPGLIAAPSTQQDDIITLFLDAADLGVSRTDADRFGLANLRRLEDDVTYLGDEGARIAFVSGTGYGASRALVLDTVLRESLEVEHAPFGVLAAVPARDNLMLHVIEDLSMIPALGLMLSLAARSYARDPGPLSPDVYLVTPELVWHPATTAPPGDLRLRPSAEFEVLARRLATGEHTR
ncbi:hypothetical protein ACXJJ3_17560 [Kribbella sp. WER1]